MFAATAGRSSGPSSGVYFARQNMLSQVGTVTTNGVQQQTIALGTFATGFATDAGLARSGESDTAACRVSFPLAVAFGSSTRTT